MQKHNTQCSICGKSYYVCSSCNDTKHLNPWKIHTDTSEHYKIYQILHGYTIGIYNANEAKSKLDNVDLKDFDTYRDNIKEQINRIINNSKKTVKTKKSMKVKEEI